MRLKESAKFKLLKSVGLLLVLCSCSSGSSPEPGEPVEIKPKSSTNIDLPEQELLTNAKRQYQNSLQSVSRESFRSLKNNFPTGPYAEYSEIKIADTLFRNAEYSEALKAYEDYAKSRPTSVAVPYCLLMAGRSAELSSAGVGRDPNPFQRALGLYDDLLTRFPESVYAAAAAKRKAGVREILAEYELEVINFYYNQGKDQIAEQREKEFKQTYNISAEDFEPSGYQKREAIEESAISARLAGAAKNYLKSLPQTVEPKIAVQDSVPQTDKIIVSSVSCDKKQKLVLLYLSSAVSPHNLNIQKKNSEIELPVENLSTSSGEGQKYSCFGEGDLLIDPSGLIKIVSDSEEPSAFFAQNPARIIINLAE